MIFCWINTLERPCVCGENPVSNQVLDQGMRELPLNGNGKHFTVQKDSQVDKGKKQQPRSIEPSSGQEERYVAMLEFKRDYNLILQNYLQELVFSRRAVLLYNFEAPFSSIIEQKGQYFITQLRLDKFNIVLIQHGSQCSSALLA